MNWKRLAIVGLLLYAIIVTLAYLARPGFKVRALQPVEIVDGDGNSLGSIKIDHDAELRFK